MRHQTTSIVQGDSSDPAFFARERERERERREFFFFASESLERDFWSSLPGSLLGIHWESFSSDDPFQRE